MCRNGNLQSSLDVFHTVGHIISSHTVMSVFTLALGFWPRLELGASEPQREPKYVTNTHIDEWFHGSLGSDVMIKLLFRLTDELT